MCNYRNDYHLTICSMDGTVKSIIFDSKELGRLLTSSEMVIGWKIFDFFSFIIPETKTPFYNSKYRSIIPLFDHAAIVSTIGGTFQK